jgi:hypothetical protein
MAIQLPHIQVEQRADASLKFDLQRDLIFSKEYISSINLT